MKNLGFSAFPVEWVFQVQLSLLVQKKKVVQAGNPLICGLPFLFCIHSTVLCFFHGCACSGSVLLFNYPVFSLDIYPSVFLERYPFPRLSHSSLCHGLSIQVMVGVSFPCTSLP